MIDVSVIVPVYNSENTVERAITSAFGQKNVEIEVVCVDDGSKDNSWSVMTACAERFANLRILQQENGGAASARNRALREAKGRFVAFLDSDDFFYDEMALSCMVKRCDEYHVKMCGSVMLLCENGQIHPSSSRKRVMEDSELGILKYIDSQYDYDFTSYIYDRSMLVEHEIFFPEIVFFEDPPFLVRALHTAGQYVECEAKLYCYVIGQTFKKITRVEQVEALIDGLAMNIRYAMQHNLFTLIDRSMIRLIYEYGDYIFFHLRKSEALRRKVCQIIDEFSTTDIKYDFKRLIERPYEDFEVFLRETIETSSEIFVFGNGMIAKQFALYFEARYREKNISGYVVSQKKDDDSCHVISLKEYVDLDSNGVLIIAVSGIYVGEIVHSLQEYGVENYLILDTVFLAEIC